MAAHSDNVTVLTGAEDGSLRVSNIVSQRVMGQLPGAPQGEGAQCTKRVPAAHITHLTATVMVQLYEYLLSDHKLIDNHLLLSCREIPQQKCMHTHTHAHIHALAHSTYVAPHVSVSTHCIHVCTYDHLSQSPVHGLGARRR